MELPLVFLTLGGLFLLGLGADQLGRRIVVPRVTLLMLAGVVAGGAGLGLIPREAQAWYDFLTVTALTMVAFLLGGSLGRDALAAHGRLILWISVTVIVVCGILVSGGLWALGVDPVIAISLGAIAAATDPAATRDVIVQWGQRSGFIETLEGIVAIDDAWGLILFALALTLAHALNGAVATEALEFAAWELGGAFLLGAAIGVPAAYLTGRISEGEPLQAEALAIVFLTAGTALLLDVSYLIAGMTAGTIVVNLARHHERSFHEIEHIQWPFMLLFFVLAGASLDMSELLEAGALGLGYIVLRTLSRLVGGWLGAAIARAPESERRWYGVALMPQAGVAVGMALIAAREFPEHAEVLLTVTIASTVVFELAGPLATRWAIQRVTDGAAQR